MMPRAFPETAVDQIAEDLDDLDVELLCLESEISGNNQRSVRAIAHALELTKRMRMFVAYARLEAREVGDKTDDDGAGSTSKSKSKSKSKGNNKRKLSVVSS